MTGGRTCSCVRFRTIDDALGKDLSWYWGSWFSRTDPLDFAIDDRIATGPDRDRSEEGISRYRPREQHLGASGIGVIRHALSGMRRVR